MRISDWSSDVCSSDLARGARAQSCGPDVACRAVERHRRTFVSTHGCIAGNSRRLRRRLILPQPLPCSVSVKPKVLMPARSEEHTSELQSLMRISYAVFCLKKKKKQQQHEITYIYQRSKDKISNHKYDTYISTI